MGFGMTNARRFKTLAAAISTFGIVDAARFYAYRSIGRRLDVETSFGDVPITLRSATPDYKVALESLGSEFEPLRPSLSIDFDGLIVDAGGYIGTAAIKFAQMFPSARVVTIEPSSENFRVLSSNVKRFKNIIALNFALHTESGVKLKLRRGPGDQEWGFSVVESGRGAAFEEVDTISIADLYSEFGAGGEVGIFKLDIEGAEKKILEECATDLSRAKVVIAELHDRMVPGCSAAFERFSRGRTVVFLPGEKRISVR